MDGSSVSSLWYRTPKRAGKLRQRIQDLRIPSSFYNEFTASRPSLDLSHNESARLAADCLLNQGLEGYQEMLNIEGEVDFLSEAEKNYIKENVRDANTVDSGPSDDDDETELQSSHADSKSPTRRPAVSTNSDTTVAALELPGVKDVQWGDPFQDRPTLKVFFQSDSKAAGMKDVVRGFIRKAKTVLLIVMDSFSDVELLCDLLEASRRNVSIHLLLDHLNLSVFVSMWQEIKLNSKNFPVHRSIAILFKGSTVTHFQQEFQRLYRSSKPVPAFTAPLSTTSNDSVSQLKSSQNKTICCSQSEDVQSTQKKAQMLADVPSSGLSNPNAELESSISKTHPLHIADTQTETKPFSQTQIQTQPCPKNVTQAGTIQSVSMGKAKHAAGSVFNQHDAKTNMESVQKNDNQTQAQAQNKIHVSHTDNSYIQPQLTGRTITTTTGEKAAELQESNTMGSLTHAQHNTVHYQSPFNTKSNFDHHNVGTETLFLQQRNIHWMTQPSGIITGLNAQRGQWSYPLNLNQNVDFVSHPRGHTSGLETNVLSFGTRRQDPPQWHRQAPLQLHPTTESPGFLPATGTKLHLNWTYTERPRHIVRQSSFSSTYGIGQVTGGQQGWRSFHSRAASLVRSKSMTE
ncbi:protein FAM83D-like [Scomber scombrus]|uniref:Protein FAM83D-like n=1 Tax=Scomber scombrus TaxID=13677 RepID=A0AAV1N4L0_SCOSC